MADLKGRLNVGGFGKVDNTPISENGEVVKPKIVMACDHGGFRLKEYIRKYLESKGYTVEDVGIHSEKSVDYPDMAELGAKKIINEECKFGIFICGTGIGISIAANKIRGIRAALCHNEFMARATRAHNDANVLCLGGRVIGRELALSICDAFINSRFDGGRHQIRIEKIESIERSQYNVKK